MKEWALGFIIVLLTMRVIRMQISGIIAWIFLTILPYFVGVAIMEIITHNYCP